MSRRIDPKLPIVPAVGDDPAIPLMKPDRYMDRLVRRLNELFYDLSGNGFVQADYVVLSANSDLTSERVLTAGTNITITDGGANGTVTISSTAGGSVAQMSVIASENMSAGAYANIFSSAGSFRARKAKASADGFEAFGWTNASVSSGATATLNFLGINTLNAGLTPGTVFLSETAGEATSTCPTGAGKVAQQIGVAQNATDVAFEWHQPVLLAASATAGTAGRIHSQEFTASGTFTVPAGVEAVWLTMVGAGGGGYGTGVTTAGGSGGGAGELIDGQLVPTTPGGTVTVTIGAKGTGGAAGGNAGGDGGTTSFGSVWKALGGLGATGNAAGGGGGGIRGGAASAAATQGALGTSETPTAFGGSAGGGGSSGAGAGGAGGGSAGLLAGGAGGATASTKGGGGGGAATRWGIGGAGGNGEAVGSNAAATSYGAGGGGGGGAAAVGHAGGDGCDGYVLVVWIA